MLSIVPAVLYTAEVSGSHGATFISENVKTQMGYRPEDFLSAPDFWADHIHPDDKSRVFEALPKLFEQGHHVHEYRFQHKNGDYRWMRDELKLSYDEGGNPRKIIGYWIDVTEKKLADLDLEQRIEDRTAEVRKSEQLLRQNEAKLKLAARTARLGYWHFDEVSEEYLDISDELANIFGYTSEEYLGRFKSFEHDMKLVHPDDLAAVYKAYEAGIPNGIDYRVFHRDGSVRYVREISQSIRDYAGNLVESIGTLQDITDHQLALDALGRSEKHYSTLFNQLPIGVQEQDYSSIKKTVDKLRKQGVNDIKEYLEANPSLLREMVGGIRITGVNKALIKIHRDDAIENYIRDEEDISLWWNGQWVEYFAAEIGAFSRSSEKFDAECVDIRSDNSEFNVRLISSVVSGYEDTWERVISIAEDITEKKQKEVVLIEAMARAEKASRAKSEFLSSMSHELRTPMNAILGFAQILGRNREGQTLNEKQRNYVEHILHSGEHLVELIDQVLELSKIEAGQLSINFEHISVQNVIDESLVLIRTLAQQNNIEILDQIDRSELPVLWTDATRLKQILLNLLTNAVKYNRDKGIVTLSCNEIPERMLRISVDDTGIGIAKDKQHNLFTPFERLGREGGAIGGTGIGLAITRQVIELLGGDIDFRSQEGKGSTFWIDIPIDVVQATSGDRPQFIPSTPE